MTFLLPEPRKKANYVCGTINPRQLFPFSLFCLCSAYSYDSTAYIVQKLLTLIARLGSQFELKIRFILSPGIASDTMHDFAYCILLLFYPLSLSAQCELSKGSLSFSYYGEIEIISEVKIPFDGMV